MFLLQTGFGSLGIIENMYGTIPKLWFHSLKSNSNLLPQTEPQTSNLVRSKPNPVCHPRKCITLRDQCSKVILIKLSPQEAYIEDKCKIAQQVHESNFWVYQINGLKVSYIWNIRRFSSFMYPKPKFWVIFPPLNSKIFE